MKFKYWLNPRMNTVLKKITKDVFFPIYIPRGMVDFYRLSMTMTQRDQLTADRRQIKLTKRP